MVAFQQAGKIHGGHAPSAGCWNNVSRTVAGSSSLISMRWTRPWASVVTGAEETRRGRSHAARDEAGGIELHGGGGLLGDEAEHRAGARFGGVVHENEARAQAPGGRAIQRPFAQVDHRHGSAAIIEQTGDAARRLGELLQLGKRQDCDDLPRFQGIAILAELKKKEEHGDVRVTPRKKMWAGYLHSAGTGRSPAG